MIHALLVLLRTNPSPEITSVLGEQLQVCIVSLKFSLCFELHWFLCLTNFAGLLSIQFLVSKLVACCIPSESKDGCHSAKSSEVLSLLHMLTVDSDPSMYDYIRVSFCHSTCMCYSKEVNFIMLSEYWNILFPGTRALPCISNFWWGTEIPRWIMPCLLNWGPITEGKPFSYSNAFWQLYVKVKYKAPC